MELNNVTCKKVIVSNETLGNHLRLYSVRPYYHYDENNVRTDIIDGYSYSVICPTLENNFLGVKIPGKQLLFDDSYDHLVQFNNLRVGIYPRFARGENRMPGKFSPSIPPFLMFLLSLSFSYPRFRFSQSQLTLSHRDKGLRVVPRFAEKTGMADSQGERGIPQPNL